VTRLCALASMPRKRMGLPPRSLAADAHDCIMVRSRSGICRIQGRGARSLRSTLAGSPQIVLSLLAQAKRHRAAPSLPPCSGRSRSGLETLPHAERLERRPSLTGPLRAAAMRAPRVGTKGWAPLGSNKRIGKKVRKEERCRC